LEKRRRFALIMVQELGKYLKENPGLAEKVGYGTLDSKIRFWT